jgi:uncharacterized protein HemX
MSTTPRTDAALQRSGGLLDMTNFARELERECARQAEEIARLREALTATQTQYDKVSEFYATETKRHNETWVRMEGYRKDLEFAATKLERAGLLND